VQTVNNKKYKKKGEEWQGGGADRKVEGSKDVDNTRYEAIDVLSGKKEKVGMLSEARASWKDRRKDGAKNMEGVRDDCSKEAILSGGDQSQEGRREVDHAGDPWKEALNSME